MTKTNGTRGKGQAKFYWNKTEFKHEALATDSLDYLSELASIMTRLFDGKKRTDDQLEALESRQYEIADILYHYHAVNVDFPTVQKVGA
jgi:hypothetical protein